MANVALEAVDVTADGTAFTGKGDYYGCYIGASGSAIIYDNTAASGRVLQTAIAPGGMLAGNYVQFETGLHVDLTTATHVTVYFVRR